MASAKTPTKKSNSTSTIVAIVAIVAGVLVLLLILNSIQKQKKEEKKLAAEKAAAEEAARRQAEQTQQDQQDEAVKDKQISGNITWYGSSNFNDDSRKFTANAVDLIRRGGCINVDDMRKNNGYPLKEGCCVGYPRSVSTAYVDVPEGVMLECKGLSGDWNNYCSSERSTVSYELIQGPKTHYDVYPKNGNESHRYCCFRAYAANGYTAG